MKKIYLAALLLISSFSLFAAGPGADVAYPKIEKLLKEIPIPTDKIYICSDESVEKLVSASADIEINIFELIDCAYRYLSKNKMRIVIRGESLKRLMDTYDYGRERVLGLMPIPLIEKIYLGHVSNPDEKPLQVYLTQKYKKYVEIGTAIYDQEFGFNVLKPHFFLEPYGMWVKKFGIKFKLKKIHLYEPSVGAVYVKGFHRPKKWYLYLITRIEKEDKEKTKQD